MAHKLGAFHHLPHGLANAVILTRVMRYNAAEAPVKMGNLLPVSLPQRAAQLRRNGQVLRHRGQGRQGGLRELHHEARGAKDFIGVKKTIADYGVDEQYSTPSTR